MYRLYCEEQLQLRSKLRSDARWSLCGGNAFALEQQTKVECLDFVSDQLADGTR